MAGDPEPARRRRRGEASDVLLRVANVLATTDAFEDILRELSSIVREALDANRCTILIADPETGALRPGASTGKSPDPNLYRQFLKMAPLPAGGSPTLSQRLSAGHGVVVPDASASDLVPRAWVEAFGLEALVLFPLRHRGELVGLMVAEYSHGKQIQPEELATIEAVAHQAAMVVGHAGANESLRRATAELEERVLQQSILLEASVLLGSNLDLESILQNIAESLATVLPVTYCRIAIWDQPGRRLVVRAGYSRRGGRETVLLGHTIDPSNSPWHAQVLRTRQPLKVSGTDAQADDATLRTGAQSLLLLPLAGEQRLFGVITIGEERHESRSAFGAERIDFYRTLSSQAALAIERAHLFESRQESYWEAIHGIASVVEVRDMGTHEHVYRVSALARDLGRRLDVTGEDLVAVERAGILHDFGKISVPDRVLLKPGPLTEEEWAEMRTHSTVGGRLLARIPFLEPSVPLIRHHHESWDGRGYPDKLRREQIPLGSRIIAVADAYDAMTTTRPYRAALTSEHAYDEIRKHAGRQFDPAVAGVFCQAYEAGDIGRLVGEVRQRLR